MATPTLSNFHNHSNAQLADVIGDLDAQAKALSARLKAAKGEFLTRGLGRVHGERFTVTKSEAARWSLDAKAIKAELGEDWCTARSRVSAVTSLRIAVNRAALTAAA